jgi:hypothetical protein
MTYGEIKDALRTVQSELAGVREHHGDYARDYMSAQREWRKQKALKFLDVDGKNKEEREAKVIQALWQTDHYKDYVHAEANWKGSEAKLDALKTEAMVLLGMLKDEKELSYGGNR